jgi:hypothetical protein
MPKIHGHFAPLRLNGSGGIYKLSQIPYDVVTLGRIVIA